MTTQYQRWRAQRPTIGEAHRDATSKLHAVVTVLFLLGVFGVVGEMDYRDALRAEAEAQQTSAADNRAALIACLNGRATGHYTENHRGERAYIICRGAEEIPVGQVVANNG